MNLTMKGKQNRHHRWTRERSVWGSENGNRRDYLGKERRKKILGNTTGIRGISSVGYKLGQWKLPGIYEGDS